MTVLTCSVRHGPRDMAKLQQVKSIIRAAAWWVIGMETRREHKLKNFFASGTNSNVTWVQIKGREDGCWIAHWGIKGLQHLRGWNRKAPLTQEHATAEMSKGFSERQNEHQANIKCYKTLYSAQQNSGIWHQRTPVVLLHALCFPCRMCPRFWNRSVACSATQGYLQT